jgi:hypothetical protein
MRSGSSCNTAGVEDCRVVGQLWTRGQSCLVCAGTVATQSHAGTWPARVWATQPSAAPCGRCPATHGMAEHAQARMAGHRGHGNASTGVDAGSGVPLVAWRYEEGEPMMVWRLCYPRVLATFLVSAGVLGCAPVTRFP